jgi:hypothetical protein
VEGHRRFGLHRDLALWMTVRTASAKRGGASSQRGVAGNAILPTDSMRSDDNCHEDGQRPIDGDHIPATAGVRERNPLQRRSDWRH